MSKASGRDGWATSPADGGGRRAFRRGAAMAEVALFVGSILAFIWAIQPFTGRPVHIAYYVAMLGFACVSAVSHGESPRSVGLRFDNFGAAARLVVPVTFVLMLGVAIAGRVAGTQFRVTSLLTILAPYFVWALIQQYALQVLVQRRLWDAGLDRWSPLLGGVLFALTHLPNPGLVALTFFGGWMWAAFYRRCPNLFALALSHAVLAAIVVTALPASFTAHLRVGPGYWH